MLSNAFRYNAGLIRANGVPFFTGDGSTDSATLLDRHGNPIRSGKVKRVDVIHRTDWQGRQLLYPTARTNHAWSTGDLTTSAYGISIGGSGSLIRSLAAAGSAPDGMSAATSLVFDIGTGASSGDIAQIHQTGHALTAGNPEATSLWLRTADGSTVLMTFVDVAGATHTITVAPAWQRVAANNVVVGGVFVMRLRLRGNENTAKHADVLAWGLQVEDGAAPTPYVANGSLNTDLTVTDYTLNGTSVDFGEAPLAGALCDWTGVARR